MQKEIPLMNLARQYDCIKNEINPAVLEVLASGHYIMGDEVTNFEKRFADYCGTKYAIGVGNGTDALVLALKSIGVGMEKDDEVIVPAMTFFASAEAVSLVGAKPIFVDVNLHDGLIDASQIVSKITKNTKAIIPVHLYGKCADMDTIMSIAEKYNILVIEDAAQASGAIYKGRKAGSIGHIGCFSFFPTKNLGCAGDGGAITTNIEVYANICRALRVHGSGNEGLFAYNVYNSGNQLESVDFCDHPSKYFNFLIGYNSRLDAIQARILNTKLDYLDRWNNIRQQIAFQYDSRIASRYVKIYRDNSRDNMPIYYVYNLYCESRNDFAKYLKIKGISTGIYFPVPLHLQYVYRNLGYVEGDFPNAEQISHNYISIPMFPELTQDEIDYIISAINEYDPRVITYGKN